MAIKYGSREKKISNHACRVFREISKSNMSKSEVGAIIKNSKRRYHITTICFNRGLDFEAVLCTKSSYRCVILSGYTSTDEGEPIIAWQKIDTDGKYKGLHIDTEKNFKQMITKDTTGFIGVVVFDNWMKQQSFLENIKK